MSSFLTEVEGFTPVIDVVVKDVGMLGALVYGRVWRYCQMEDRVCRASLEKIANQIGVSRKTVERYIKDLCDKGYLIDTTPTRRNRPHIYADAGKLIINGLISIKHGQTESHTNEDGKTESRIRSDTESDRGKTESPMKIVFEDSKEEKEPAPIAGEKRDYLEDILKFSKSVEWDNNRPKGYREATPEEYDICERVANLWMGGKLPWATDDIEKNVAAARQLLLLHNGDRRATVRTIDEYHAQFSDDGMHVTGPYSLRNVIPKFLSDSKESDIIEVRV